MGWWRTNPDGQSLLVEGDMVWGDPAADIIDVALTEIIAAFKEGLGRTPTKAEIRAGLEFSLSIYTEDMKEDS
jgi:hypothetical protein